MSGDQPDKGTDAGPPPDGEHTDTGRSDEGTDTLVEDEQSGKDAPTAKRPRTRGDLARTGVRGAGQTLITLGVIVLLFVVYELWVTNLITDARQDQLAQSLREDWGNGDDPSVGPQLPEGGGGDIPLGTGIGFIRIPAFGQDYNKVIIEGTNPDDLDQGPGHYVDSALPGEMGNFSIAGHRVGKGSPFLDLDLLQPGDAIVIETAEEWFVYRMLGDPASGDVDADPSGIPGRQIVQPEDVEVINPVPGDENVSAEPTAPYLTLTTCHPKFSAQQRLIVHAMLDGQSYPKSEFPDGPPALTEG